MADSLLSSIRADLIVARLDARPWIGGADRRALGDATRALRSGDYWGASRLCAGVAENPATLRPSTLWQASSILARLSLSGRGVSL